MIKNLQTAPSVHLYSQKVGLPDTSKAAESSGTSSTINSAKADYVHLSQEARDALKAEQAMTATADFVRSKGQQLFEQVLKNTFEFPENLASKLEDDSLSPEERGAIQNAITEREFVAFTKYAKQSPPDLKMYYLKYVEYLDSLSPEERQSDRYAGQRASAVTAYENAARSQGEQPEDLTLRQHPNSLLLELIFEKELEVEELADIREKFTQQMDTLVEGNSSLRGQYDQMLGYYDAITSVIDASKEPNEPNEEALNQLNKLADDPPYMDEFLRYSKELSQ